MHKDKQRGGVGNEHLLVQSSHLACVAHPPLRRRPSVPLRGLWLAAGSLTSVLLPGCLLSPTMAAQLVVALLAFTSLSAAASEPDCKELVKPLVLDSHSPVSISDMVC